MLRLLYGVVVSLGLIFAPSLAKSMNLSDEMPSSNVEVAPAAPTCVAGGELQSRFKAEKMKEAKQVWVAKPSALEKLNAHFGTKADWAILVYFGGVKLGYGLWACGKPLEGYSKVISYREMAKLMNQTRITADETVMVSNQGR